MKLERLLSITFMLLNREVVSAAELAEKFQVSQRTIYRDIEAIGAAGIPIVSYQGTNGGFGIMEGFKIDKRLLHSYDVESIITVLKGVSSIFDDDKYSDALDTFRGILPDPESEKLVMDFGSWSRYRELLNKIKTAVIESRVVGFNYTNTKGETEYRLVEPVTIVLKFNTWYLYGFCRKRRDFRIFRLSRIQEFELNKESFFIDRDNIKELKFNFINDADAKYIDVELKFSPRAFARALDVFYAEDKIFNEDGTVSIKIYGHPEDQWIYSNILSFGEDVTVISPEHLKITIREKAKKIYEKYEEV